MKKLFFTATMILCCFGTVNCQNAKTQIAIFPFVAPLSENKGRAVQLQQYVVEILRKKSNIELIDRSNDSLLVKELDIQIREQSVAAGGLVQQGKLLGAKQLIIGTLSNVNVTSKTSTNYNAFTKSTSSVTQYTATINFALQLSDVETGRVISQKVFNSNEGSVGLLGGLLAMNNADSPENAILKALNSSKKQISQWINQSYPPEIKILRIDERDRKGNPETVLVSGIDASLQRGSQVIVNLVEMIDAGDGKSLRRSKKLAELKVKEIQGDITICKVTDGEKELEEKMTGGAQMEFVIK